MRRFRPYLKYLRSVRGYFVAATLCAAVYGFVYGFVLNYVLMQKVFPALFKAGGPRLDDWKLWGYAALVPAVFLVRGLASYFNAYFVSLCGVKILEQIRVDFFRKLQELPLSFYARHSSGDLISRGLADTNQLQFTLTNVANEIFKQPATLLFSLGTLVYLGVQNRDVWVVLLCLASVPVCVFPIRYAGKHVLRRARQMQEQLGAVTDRLSENLSATKEVRAFGLEARETERFSTAVQSLFSVQMKVVKYSSFLSPTIEFISSIGVALTLVYAYKVHLEWNIFLSIVFALFVAYEPVKKLGAINNDLKRGQSALDRLEAVLNEPVTITDPPNPVTVGRLRGDVAFAGVTFAYKPGEAVLHGLSARIPAGTVCALVGPSGAGKSTFANLVPRFYEATAGQVTIDGHDVRAMRLACATTSPSSRRIPCSSTTPFTTTSCSGARAPRASRWSPRRATRTPTISSRRCPRVMKPWSANAAPCSPAARSSASPWPAPSCATPRSSSSTRPRPRSIRRASSSSRRHSGNWSSARPS